MSQDSFGAGIFEESQSKPMNPSQPPAVAANPASPTPEASSQEAPSQDEPGQDDFFAQKERDREKAMLLRRTREDGPAELPPQEVDRRPNGGNRWSGGPQQNDRPRRGGGRPNFGGDFRNEQRRGGSGNERPPIERTPAVETSERETFAPAPALMPRENREGVDFRDRRTTTDRRQQAPITSGTVLLDQRVAILVDVQNMYHSARKLHGRNLSYSKLIQNAVKGRKLVRAIAYLLDREGVDQGGFLEHLSHSGFEVRRKELIERPDGTRKGDWDLGIAIDAITLAEKVDAIILVSGDGDFVCLAQLLRHRGIKVEIAAFRESTADALLGSADAFHPLGKDSLY